MVSFKSLDTPFRKEILFGEIAEDYTNILPNSGAFPFPSLSHLPAARAGGRNGTTDGPREGQQGGRAGGRNGPQGAGRLN